MLGVALALLSGLSRLGEALLDGPIQIKRAIPSLALLPLLILWLGIGESMKVVTILPNAADIAASRTAGTSSAGWSCRARYPGSCSACGSR